jgi:hypothetical protein
MDGLMRVVKYPADRRYDLAANQFSGAVTVEIDGQEHRVQAARGLDCADAERHIRNELTMNKTGIAEKRPDQWQTTS